MFKSIKKYWRTIAAAVVSYYTFGIASGWIAGSGFLSGAVAGGAAGFMGGAEATGTLTGALQGAFTGAVFGGLGGHLSTASTPVQVGAHSLAGGVVSKLQGGNFGHGFFSAGFTKWAGKTWHIDTGSARNVIGNSLKQAIIGGTASKITGNKFSNGAFTAALQYIVNEAGSRLSPGKSLDEYMEEKYGKLTITEEEWGYVEAGDRESFWNSRLNRGDPLAPVAISILNDDWVSVGGYRLTYGYMANGLTGLSGEALNALGVDLMRAHADAVTHDYNQKIGIPGLLSPRQAAEYHHEVFRAHNISPGRFGGTPFYISPNITRNFWCPGCDHTGSTIR